MAQSNPLAGFEGAKPNPLSGFEGAVPAQGGALAGFEGAMPAESHPIRDLLMKAITPIPALAAGKEQAQQLIAQGNAPLEQALQKVGIGAQPGQASSQNPFLQAAISARRAMVPLPSTELLQRTNEMVFPTTPLDVAGSVAAPMIEAARPILKGMLGTDRVVQKAAPRLATMTVDEAAAHMEELKRASIPAFMRNPSGQLTAEAEKLEAIRTAEGELSAARAEAEAARPDAQFAKAQATKDGLYKELNAQRKAIVEYEAGMKGNPQASSKELARMKQHMNGITQQIQELEHFTSTLKDMGPKGGNIPEAHLARVKDLEAKVSKAHFEHSLSRQVPAVAPSEPLVKPIQATTPIQTVVNLGERAARPRLSSEIAIQGLEQTTEASRKIADEAVDKIKKGLPLELKEGQQITDWVVEGVRSGDLDPSVAARYLGMPGLQDVFSKAGPAEQIEFAKNIRKISSQLGYGLSQFARIRKAYDARLEPALKAVFEADKPTSSVYNLVNNVFRYVESFRKQAMVSNLSLAMRDFFTHGGRYTLNAIEDSMNGVMGAMTGKIPAKDAFNAGVQDLFSLAHSMTGSQRSDVLKLMEQFPAQAEKLVGTPYGELSNPGKFMKMLNTIHNASFTLFQKASLDSFLRNRAGLLGTTVERLGPKDFAEAIEHAQAISFTRSFKQGTFFGDVLTLYRNHPWLTAVGQTFPRMWANLLTTIHDFSPIPLMRPSTYAKMASKDPKIAFGAVNKSIQGMGIVAAGWAASAHGNLDGKWSDLKIGKHSLDLRRWHPFATPFIVGGMLHKGMAAFQGALERGQSKEEAVMAGLSPLTKLSGSDWSELLLSMKRTDLSGIPIVDAIQATSEQTGVKRAKDAVLNFMGQYLSSFEPSILTRTPLDIMGQWNKEDRLPRFVRDRPVMGPMIQNVPFASRTLPVRYSPMRPEPEEKDNPGLQQMTGAVTRVKTPAELEADRLGLTFRDLYPSTGNPTYDNLIAQYMGPQLERGLGRLMSSKSYMQHKDAMKRDLFKMIVDVSKSASADIALGKIPADQAIEQMQRKQEKLLKDAIHEAAQ